MGYPQCLVSLAAQVWQQVKSMGLIHLYDQRRIKCGMRHFEDQAYQECSSSASLNLTPVDLMVKKAIKLME